MELTKIFQYLACHDALKQYLIAARFSRSQTNSILASAGEKCVVALPSGGGSQLPPDFVEPSTAFP
ncbi:hypothetical protein E2C01_023973 [Portunus trituberculatus]|uniref:Uncharacterized protein n=1 Tax=Portunus trituberculatus TaxID=210409 RepID=A0A5B7ECL4_PORTR|nr:hypothetical protein [Portunus trituberculatus]